MLSSFRSEAIEISNRLDEFFQKVYSFRDGIPEYLLSSHVYNFFNSFTLWLSIVSGTKMFIISFRDPLHLHRYRPLLMHQLDLFFSFHICETLMLLGKFKIYLEAVHQIIHSLHESLTSWSQNNSHLLVFCTIEFTLKTYI